VNIRVRHPPTGGGGLEAINSPRYRFGEASARRASLDESRRVDGC